MAVKRSFILASFSKEKAEQVADEYEALPFWKKPKNIAGLFYIVVCVFTLVIKWYTPMDEYINGVFLSWSDILLTVMVYAFLAMFIFLNYRWAMTLGCLMYLLDKAIFLVIGGFSIVEIVIGFVCILLTSRAILTANALKSRKTVNISTFD